jgi:hypothetical protein
MAEPRKRRRNNPETAGPEPKQSAQKTNKRERLFALAEKNYAPRKATRWPYLLRGERQYRFEGPDRRSLRADLRALWREEHPGEATPSDADLNSVIDDLRARAEKADPDAPTAEDEESQILAAHGIGETPADRGLGLVSRGDDCPLPDGYVIPEPYLVTADGIHILKGDGTGPARVAWAWLFPVRMYVDPDGDQLVELAWRDGARWVTRLIRRSLTKSGRKLIAEAGDAGLPVIEADARQAERWLAAAEAANRGVIARHPVARQLGWQADGKTFVTAQDSPWRIEPRYSDQAAALAAHRPQGTLAAWQEAMRGIEEYIVVRAGLYAGLAAPLLIPLDLDSFTVDFAGKSGRGKTITAMVALSCWADPSDRADGMFTWQSASQIGVEKRLNLLNGLVAVIDETRLVKDPALVDTVLYMVPKNHGAPRGGGWPNMIPWRAIVISTGEQPATSFTSHQGASPRVLGIGGAPFGTDGADSRTAAESVKHGVEANHGIAGPAFVARLRKRLAEDGGLEKLRGRHGELTDLLRGSTDVSGRRAPLVACLELAAELAAEWEIVPFGAPDTDTWLSLLASEEQRDNRPEMALDIVREYIAAHSDKLWGGPPKGDQAAGGDERPPSTGWIGRDLPGGVALLPEKLREELKRRGYELDAVIPGWRERAVLVEKNTHRPSYKLPVRLGSHARPVKCFVFKSEHLEDPQAWEE